MLQFMTRRIRAPEINEDRKPRHVSRRVERRPQDVPFREVALRHAAVVHGVSDGCEPAGLGVVER